jgi:plastocyanin
MRRPLVLLAAAAMSLSGCADGGDEDEGSPTTTGPTAATGVDVSATEFAFDVPEKVTGGVVEMRFTNTGGLPHEFAFARIEKGKTEADVKAVIESGGEPPEWAEDVAGVPGLSPGQSITVTRTLEPGSYVFLCFFPDPEGTPHANLGMYELFTIAGDTGASLPEPDATITATDDGLQVPALTSGGQTVEFENGGTKRHELALVAFAPGKGIKDVDRWFGSGYQGEPPVTFLGGMQTIPAGESVFLTIDLEAGVQYTAIDFTTESQETFTVS